MSHHDRPDRSKRLPTSAIVALLVVGTILAFEFVLRVPSVRSAITDNPAASLMVCGVLGFFIWGLFLYRRRNSTPEYLREVLVFFVSIGIVVSTMFSAF